MHRASPLQVGGVGKGVQQCLADCRLPIALSRHDDSAATGTHTAPVVSQSACPALLGLKTLQDRRAILDCDKKLLHFPSTGEVTLKLPPGSETFQLEAAESGHLLLPCDSFQHMCHHLRCLENIICLLRTLSRQVSVLKMPKIAKLLNTC